MQDITTMGIAAMAAVLCPWKNVRAKVMSFGVFMWRLIVLVINCLEIDPSVSPAILIFLGLSVVTMTMRNAYLCKLPSDVQPTNGEAYLAYLPVHSWAGLAQALLMPWHLGRYETRAMVDNGHVWLVHRHRFKRVHMPPERLVKQGAVLVPLGSHLTASEREKLDAMIGKRAIMGIRDCRKLVVRKPQAWG